MPENDVPKHNQRVLGWGAIVTGLSILILVLGVAVGGIIVASHVGTLSTDFESANTHRDEVGSCVSILQGRWFSSVTAVLVTPKGPEQDYWINVAEQTAVRLAHAHDTCYVDHPDPGPDPFEGHPLPLPPNG